MISSFIKKKSKLLRRLAFRISTFYSFDAFPECPTALSGILRDKIDHFLSRARARRHIKPKGSVMKKEVGDIVPVKALVNISELLHGGPDKAAHP